MKRARLAPVGLAAIGYPRPARPVVVYGEDFSLILRAPRRLRVARSRIRVLS